MKIKITNIDSNIIEINDLGIILNSSEYTYLDNFEQYIILDSEDLKNSIESNKVKIEIESKNYNYLDFISYFKSLTELNHENLNTLKHNLSENSYMITTKENGVVKYITYYTDSNMTEKIREEEIVRENGRSSKIIMKQYDKLGNILFTEEQTLNRNTNGKVESIGIIKK